MINKIIRNSLLLFLVLVSFSFASIHCNKEKEIVDPVKADTTKPIDTIQPVDTTHPIDTTVVIKPDTTAKKEPLYLFAGTYSGGNSKGIYVYKMDSITGALSLISTFQTSNPSYVCVHPNKKWIYSVGEDDNGMVKALSFDTAQKKLSLLNSVSSKGKAPCFVSVDKSGKYVMVANYTSGNISLFPIDDNGSLKAASSVIQHTGSSINKSRQNEPHAHMIAQEAQNNIVYASDLGIDKLMAYKIDEASNKLVSTGLNTIITPGTGPRHFAGHKKLQVMYVLGELLGTIEAFNVNSTTGELKRFQIISNMEKNDTRFPGSADIHITPNGKFLYATNRSDVNTIGMYSINQTTGELSLIGFESTKGNGPRNFAIDPSGKFLLVANQNTSNVVVFTIDANTGALSDSGIKISIPNVVCLKFR